MRCNPANEAERYLLRRLGYGQLPDEQRQFVLMSRLGGGTEMHYAPQNWGDRTLQTAHEYITEHFQQLTAGAVVDVRAILGERTGPAIPERLVDPCE